LLQAFFLVTSLTLLAIILLGARPATGRSSLGCSLVKTVRMIVVRCILQRFTLEVILAYPVPVLFWEEATLVAPRTLLDTLVNSPVPESTQLTEAFCAIL